MADPRFAVAQREQRAGTEWRLWTTRLGRWIGKHTAQLARWWRNVLIRGHEPTRFEHAKKLVCELDLSREPVFPGAPNVSEGALDLSPKEAREDDMGVIAERPSIYVALACDKLERPSEVTGDNLLVEPVGQPADDGHPPPMVPHCRW
jgi:hypothetical protein